MRRIPNFAAIKAFEAAARLSSFSAAADELHLSPSAVSHQIRNLEGVLAIELFKRSPRSVELTVQGKELIHRLTPALDALEHALSPWLPEAGQSSLAVHCAPSFAAKWLSPRLGLLMAEPNPLIIRLTSSATAPDLMRHDEIDVAITYGSPIERTGVIAEPLGLETIVPMSSPQLFNPACTLDESTLKPHSLIDSQLSPVRWSDWLDYEGIAHHRAFTGLSFDRAALALSAAADGLGIALESTRLAETELKSGAVVVLHGHRPALLREMHFLCYRSTLAGSTRIERFKEWIMQQISLSS